MKILMTIPRFQQGHTNFQSAAARDEFKKAVKGLIAGAYGVNAAPDDSFTLHLESDAPQLTIKEKSLGRSYSRQAHENTELDVKVDFYHGDFSDGKFSEKVEITANLKTNLLYSKTNPVKIQMDAKFVLDIKQADEQADEGGKNWPVVTIKAKSFVSLYITKIDKSL